MSETTENKLGQENVETLDKLHCFGSRWFCIQMQEAFNAQAAILKEIAYKHSGEGLKAVLPVLHGLHTTADAISLLRRDGLLNEAHVLMRLLVERALNVCYLLLNPDNSDREFALSPPEKTDKAERKERVADDLIEHAKSFRFEEKYDSDALEKKITVIAANSDIPIDFLRLIVSSHHPQASLALSGSAYGAIFHLQNMKGEDHQEDFNMNFATLLLGGISLLNSTIKILGENGIPEELVKHSGASNDAAISVMKTGLRPKASDVRDAYGWWQNLSDHEYLATQRLAPSLREFETAFSACVEAGIEVPILAKRNDKSLRLKIAALYLKRMLNDVRSMWVMIRQGNTSQAGSIAASLFENALLITCVAESEPRAVQLSKKPSDKWPWDKKTMCNFVNQDLAKRQNTKADQKAADAHYFQYSCLCAIKHPTLEYVTHDSGSTQVEEKGYVVMPFPDVRDEDWPVKKKILLISLHQAITAIKSFARGGDVKEVSPNEKAFVEKIKTAEEILVGHLKGHYRVQDNAMV